MNFRSIYCKKYFTAIGRKPAPVNPNSLFTINECLSVASIQIHQVQLRTYNAKLVYIKLLNTNFLSIGRHLRIPVCYTNRRDLHGAAIPQVKYIDCIMTAGIRCPGKLRIDKFLSIGKEITSQRQTRHQFFILRRFRTLNRHDVNCTNQRSGIIPVKQQILSIR